MRLLIVATYAECDEAVPVLIDVASRNGDLDLKVELYAVDVGFVVAVRWFCAGKYFLYF